MNLRTKLVKLAYEKPSLRHHLLPLLTASRTLKIRGRDFIFNVDTTDFSAFSPDSNLDAEEPSYSVIEAKNPIGAMHLYELLNGDPKVLSKVAWANLGNWLKGHNIQFTLDFSV